MDILDKLAGGWSQERTQELLPDAWKAARTVQAQAQAADQND